MEDLAGLDSSLLVGVKDQEVLEHEVFEEVSFFFLFHSLNSAAAAQTGSL